MVGTFCATCKPLVYSCFYNSGRLETYFGDYIGIGSIISDKKRNIMNLAWNFYPIFETN